METGIATISGIVKSDYRTADVFKKHGINYCCGGNSTLEEVCNSRKLDKAAIENDLAEATKTVMIPASVRFDDWSTDFLADYIVNVHHAYLKKGLPSLELALQSFVDGHRKKFPFLDQLFEVYQNLAALLLEHTEEEEQKVFPYIKQIGHTYENKEIYGRLFVKTLSKPLNQVVQSRHKHISAHLLKLRELTDNYQFGSNACTNHQVVFQKLKELDADLVQHKHLENNILFPRAIELEKALLKL